MVQRLDIPLDTPGAAGLDRRDDFAAMPALSAAELVNLDLFTADDAAGARLLPRRWLRRWGHRRESITLVAGAAGTIPAGTYYYQYRYTTGGKSYWSNVDWYTCSGSEKINVSGWPTGGTYTVDIYRGTIGSTWPRKLVTTVNNPTANYDDNTADGALGGTQPTATYVAPVGNSSFNQTAIIEGLIPFRSDTSAIRYLYAVTRRAGVSGAVGLFRGTPDSDEGLLDVGDIAAAGPAYPLSWATLGDKLWFARGGTTIAYSTTSLSQPAAPTISSVVNAGAGNISCPAGMSHLYVAQDETIATGVRSLPSAVASIAGPYTSQRNTVTFGLTVPAGTRRHIYRTSAGGSFYQYVGNTVSGTTYSDNTADASLSQMTVPFEVGAPGGFRYIWAHKGILMVARQTSTPVSTSLVRWNSSLYPFNFPNDPTIAPDYQLDIDPDDGDEITGGVSWGELSLVFKRNRVFAITGDPPKGFRYAPIIGSNGLGCVAWRTIRETPVGLLWLSPAGVCLMRSPGATPELVSDAVRDLLIEPQRGLAALQGSTLSEEPADFEFTYAALAATAETIQVGVQLDGDPAFGSVDFDYDTTDAGEIGYFLGNNAAWPAAGLALQPGQRVCVRVRPPAPTVNTTYYVRWRVKISGVWGAWRDGGTFVKPADDVYADIVDTSKLTWAHGCHYPPRNEYWLWIPTGGRIQADTALVLGYGGMLRGGSPTWRMVRAPATAACFVDNWQIYADYPPQTANNPADYLVLGTADGLLYTYPWGQDGLDYDTRVTVVAADRRVSAVHSAGTTLTASGTTWPTGQFGLAGSVVTARDTEGLTYTGLITANTGTVLTVVWLEGRTPPNATLSIVIGGLDAYLETPWLTLGDLTHTAVIRSATLKAGSWPGVVTTIWRAAEGAGRSIREGRKRFVDIPIGRGFRQTGIPIGVRGYHHRIRYGTIADGQLWEVTGIMLSVELTGSQL